MIPARPAARTLPYVTDADRIDYTGAVYGSLLAASVVAGTSPGKEPPTVAQLVGLLLATGTVFWLAHTYARVVGDRRLGLALSWAEVRSAARRESPLAEAAVPPAAAACVCWVLALPEPVAAWAALATALAAQVAWAIVADVKSRSTKPLIAVSVLVNLLLGLVIVALKVALGH